MDARHIKGIVMSITSVQGILAGTKTATRCGMTPQPVKDESGMWHEMMMSMGGAEV